MIARPDNVIKAQIQKKVAVKNPEGLHAKSSVPQNYLDKFIQI